MTSSNIRHLQSSVLMEFSKHFHEALEQMRLYEGWNDLIGDKESPPSPHALTHLMLAAALHKATAIQYLAMAFVKLIGTDTIIMSSPMTDRPALIASLIETYNTQTENSKLELPCETKELYEFLDKVKIVLNAG